MVGFFTFTPTMTIAVSAVLKPSRLLFWLVSTMCGSVIFIAVMIVSGSIGNLSLAAKVGLAMLCVAVALYVFLRTSRNRKMHVLHISGSGQIRVAVLQAQELSNDSVEDGQGELVRLLSVSTLWPSLLLLHLQGERQQITVVTVLPDSVSREDFKALLVACRWIVSRHAEASSEHTNGN